jgi:hypoxanthine phosphoribosyltransferase
MTDAMPGSSERLAVLFSASDIAARIEHLAGQIAVQHPQRLLVVAVLNGSFIFAADLIRALHGAGLAPEIDFLALSSYREETRSSGRITVLRDLESSVQGRDVLLVDDILESGRTLAFARDLIAARGAERVTTCVLLDKRVPRAAPIAADLRAFECPDVSVVGYGMDLANRFRELPFIGHLVRERSGGGGHDGTHPSGR